VIVGHQFGWAAVSSEPMDWETFELGRQLLLEINSGRRVREAKAIEDAEYAASRSAISRRG